MDNEPCVPGGLSANRKVSIDGLAVTLLRDGRRSGSEVKMRRSATFEVPVSSDCDSILRSHEGLKLWRRGPCHFLPGRNSQPGPQFDRFHTLLDCIPSISQIRPSDID